MSKIILVIIVISWAVLMVLNYYYVPYFLLPFEWITVCFLFLTFSVNRIAKVVKERKAHSRIRIEKTLVSCVLFILTFFQFTDPIIEKIDWLMLFNTRREIVADVKNKRIKPNVSWNNVVCKLPYSFPVVSNGGNEIEIYSNQAKGTVSVSFWIFRNYFEAPSTQFVYTNDSEECNRIEEKIRQHPSNNWKICENWYRTCGD
jgi:hypothetical protein